MSLSETYATRGEQTRDGRAAGYIALLFATIYLHYGNVVPRPIATAAVGGVTALPIAYLAWARDARAVTAELPTPFVALYVIIVAIFVAHTALGNYAFLTLGLFPLYTSIVVFSVLFIIPRLVSPDVTLRSIAGVGALFGIGGTAVLSTESWARVPGFTHPALKSSVYLDPNPLALIAVVGLVMSAVVALRQRSLLWGTVAACNALFLYLTHSRGGYLALGAAVGFYAVYTQLGSRVAAVSVAAGFVALAGFVAFAAIAPFHPVIQSLPLTGRQYLWAGTVGGLLATDPVFGVGWVVAKEWVGAHAPTGFTHTPHNSYLAVALRGGVVAMVAYIALVWGSILDGIRHRIDPLVLALTVGVAVNFFIVQASFWGVNYCSVLATLVFGYAIMLPQR